MSAMIADGTPRTMTARAADRVLSGVGETASMLLTSTCKRRRRPFDQRTARVSRPHGQASGMHMHQDKREHQLNVVGRQSRIVCVRIRHQLQIGKLRAGRCHGLRSAFRRRRIRSRFDRGARGQGLALLRTRGPLLPGTAGCEYVYVFLVNRNGATESERLRAFASGGRIRDAAWVRSTASCRPRTSAR
jgi:hypothetical protein